MNKVLFLSSAMLATSLLSLGAVDAMPTESISFEQRTGGFVKKERKNAQSIFFVNAQSRVDGDTINAARDFVDELLSTTIRLTNGTFNLQSPHIEGALSLFIIDDEQLPMSLLAPEGRWAFVNVAPLAKGRGEKKAFLEARTKKEIARVASMLFGGIGSEYKKTLLGYIDDPEKLDKFEAMEIPVDAQSRCTRYLADMGIKPWKRVTYRQACEEGWAPAPTNDIQKTIWEKVHQLPTKPITIKPETKPVKE